MVRWLFALLLFVGYVAIAGRLAAVAPPLVREAGVPLSDWPEGAQPVRILLLSDVHLSPGTMSQDRLRRIVGQANDLAPDLILIAGDFVNVPPEVARERRDPSSSLHLGVLRLLGSLRAPLGTYAVLGNHDVWTLRQPVIRHLAAVGIRTLRNEVIRAGPILVAGLGDKLSGQSDVGAVAAALQANAGPVVGFTHNPDLAPDLPPRMELLLAGHTHCGQVYVPFFGWPVTGSFFGTRYLCGVVREGRRTIIVTAGLGTSRVPVRIATPPDMWLVTVGPPEISRR